MCREAGHRRGGSQMRMGAWEKSAEGRPQPDAARGLTGREA